MTAKSSWWMSGTDNCHGTVRQADDLPRFAEAPQSLFLALNVRFGDWSLNGQLRPVTDLIEHP
jgi:hypothetical protein